MGPARPRPASVRPTSWLGRLSGLRILVVDDDCQVRRMVGAILSRAGATVRLAESPQSAFESVTDFKPQLIVSDLEMPEEDGCSLMRRIRALGADSGGMPSIALSGWDAEEARAKALGAGFFAHMRKPFLPEELVRTAAAVARSG